MKKITFIFLFIINLFIMNDLFAQTPAAFEKEIEGIWTVETMAFAIKLKNAKDVRSLQKEAIYNLSVDEIGLNIAITFKDGTVFSGVSLTEISKKNKNEGLLNVSWKIGTDKKLLKKYGLTDFILTEKPTQIAGKFRIKFSIIDVRAKNTTIEKLKETDKIMTFDCVM